MNHKQYAFNVVVCSTLPILLLFVLKTPQHIVFINQLVTAAIFFGLAVLFNRVIQKENHPLVYLKVLVIKFLSFGVLFLIEHLLGITSKPFVIIFIIGYFINTSLFGYYLIKHK